MSHFFLTRFKAPLSKAKSSSSGIRLGGLNSKWEMVATRAEAAVDHADKRRLAVKEGAFVKAWVDMASYKEKRDLRSDLLIK